MATGHRLAGLGLAALLCGGCGSYHYMRDTSADLDKSRRDYVHNNPGNRYNGEIENGRIREGMSRLQVRSTWGDPDRIAPSGPGREKWAYDETEVSRGSTTYTLEFDGELLTNVGVVRGALQLSTDSNDRDKPSVEEESLKPESGKKPGGR